MNFLREFNDWIYNLTLIGGNLSQFIPLLLLVVFGFFALTNRKKEIPSKLPPYCLAGAFGSAGLFYALGIIRYVVFIIYGVIHNLSIPTDTLFEYAASSSYTISITSLMSLLFLEVIVLTAFVLAALVCLKPEKLKCLKSLMVLAPVLGLMAVVFWFIPWFFNLFNSGYWESMFNGFVDFCTNSTTIVGNLVALVVYLALLAVGLLQFGKVKNLFKGKIKQKEPQSEPAEN